MSLGLKSHLEGLLLHEENGQCDAVKHCAEFPSIVNHSPEQQVNQKWPYRFVTPPVTAETCAESFLKSGIMNEGIFEESIEGTPQGGNLSPLLANIYLNHFDRRKGDYGYLLLRYADDIVIFCKYGWEAEDALKHAKEILERELKLKLSPEKTKIVHARKKGVEFLGFHFNGRWRRPRDKAKKRFREEIRRRTRRQQPISLETVIRFLNPVIRGWGNYFKGGTVKKLFAELDGYIRGRLRSFKAKKRTWKTILYTLPEPELRKMGLISLSSLLNESVRAV